MQPWTQTDVMLKTLLSAYGITDKFRVAHYFIARHLAGRYRHKVDNGKMSIRFRDNLSLDISIQNGGLSAYYEIWCQKAYGCLSDFIPAAGNYIVDVGANIGIYSLWAGRRVADTGMIFSIEPHPSAYELLRRNIYNNGFPGKTFNVGCSDSEGFLNLSFDPSTLVTSSFQIRTGERVEKALVPVKRLDDLIDDISPNRISILKIDVERWEMQVLKGAEETLKLVDRAVLEIQGEDAVNAVSDYLMARDFDVVHEIGGVWNDPELHIIYFRRKGIR